MARRLGGSCVSAAVSLQGRAWSSRAALSYARGGERTSECRASDRKSAGANVGARGSEHCRCVQSVDRGAKLQDLAGRSPHHQQTLQQLAGTKDARDADYVAID